MAHVISGDVIYPPSSDEVNEHIVEADANDTQRISITVTEGPVDVPDRTGRLPLVAQKIAATIFLTRYEEDGRIVRCRTTEDQTSVPAGSLLIINATLGEAPARFTIVAPDDSLPDVDSEVPDGQ